MDTQKEGNTEGNPDKLDAIDSILAKAGDLGRAQAIYLAFFAWLNVFSAWHYFSQTFISITPPFTCNSPGPEECVQWREVRRAALADNNASQPILFTDTISWISVHNTTEPCTEGWTFNLSSYGSVETATSEFSWVCEAAWKPFAGQSSFFLGCAIGTLLLGSLADRIGRVPVLVAANLIAALGNIATAFVPASAGLPAFAAARLLAGLATDTNFFMMYLLVMEFLRPSLRSAGLNLAIGFFYTAGCVSVPWLATATGNWRHFLVLASLPALLIIFFPLLLPESGRWAVATGRDPEVALQTYRRIAKLNGRQLSESDEAEFRVSIKTMEIPEESKASLLGLFKTPRLRRKTCILLFKSMVLTLCYDAISRHVSGLGANPLLVFSLSSLVVLPGCAIVAALQEILGRKLLAVLALLLCGLSVAIAGTFRVLINPNDEEGRMLVAFLACLGRLSVTVAYNSGSQYVAELIPVQVQAQGVAAVHVAGYVATMLAPQVLYLELIWPALPELVLGSLAVLGSALCLFLPETLDRALPVTLADGENFGKNETPFDFAFCKKRKNSHYTSKTQLVHKP